MPFYEYECAACRYYVEVLQKITDAPLKKCPSCGKLRLKRLISAPVFRLKGSGWYETDFKSDKENKRNLAGAEPAAAEAKPAETKPTETKSSDTKATEAKAEPAAKTEATPKPAAAKTPAKSAAAKGRGARKRPAARAATRKRR
ncbi:MAG: FmdB family zinc ribbon protein [Steroidobacteraceae bacterium]|jgi:putative FmdB family regulatory protein